MHIDLEQYSTEYTVGKNVISISSKNLHFSKGVNPLLINSSNLQSFRIRFYARYTQKRQNVMGTILVAVKHLNIGVRGPGKKPSCGGGGGQDQLVPGVATLDWSPDLRDIVLK